jgi:putative solute:sodium symporter small subunit
VSPESGPATGEIRAIYLGALVRAQLRLGVLSAMAFLVTVAVAALLIASVESLHSALVFGVPWSWVLQAYGMYPIVVVFAAFYVGAARRNERRFRQLERSG